MACFSCFFIHFGYIFILFIGVLILFFYIYSVVLVCIFTYLMHVNARVFTLPLLCMFMHKIGSKN